MGAGSALQLERGYAGRLTDPRPGRRPRVDMGDAKLVAGRRVEVGVEHAIIVAELELEAGAFANLQLRTTQVLDHLVDRQAGELRRRAGLRRDLDRLLHEGRRCRGPRGAAGEEKGGSEC